MTIGQVTVNVPDVFYSTNTVIRRAEVPTAAAERAKIPGPALGSAFLLSNEYGLVQRHNQGQISDSVFHGEAIATLSVGATAIVIVSAVSMSLVAALVIGLGAAALTGAVNQGIKSVPVIAPMSPRPGLVGLERVMRCRVKAR